MRFRRLGGMTASIADPGRNMKNYQKNSQWLRDVRSRQRNVVFPDTVQNEARFWRNLGTQQWSISTAAGLGLLALFVFGSLGAICYALFNEGEGWSATWQITLAMVLFWGPILVALAWGTRRALRNLHQTRKRKR